MAKYHIDLNGEPALCKARTRACPRQEHFVSLEQAQRVAELAHEAFAEALEYPRATDPRFINRQAQIFWEFDGALGAANNVYSGTGNMNPEEIEKARLGDYTGGFEAGLAAASAENAAVMASAYRVAVAQYIAERAQRTRALVGNHSVDRDDEWKVTPWPVDESAFARGFARAQRVKNADRDEFVTEVINTGGFKEGEIRKQFGSTRLLKQPFKRGDTIVIPAGTKYNAWDANGNDASGEFSAPREITINDTFNSWVDGGGDWVNIHPAQVSYAGPHGYWRDIVLTPEIVAMNGKAVYEEALGMEELLRQPIYRDIKS